MVFSNVLVFLVDHPDWTELLIGRTTLKKNNLLRSQNFKKEEEQQKIPLN